MAIRLGDISFALGADDTALRKSVRKLEQFGKEVEKVSQQQTKGSAKASTALRKQERAILSALKKVRDLNAQTRRLGADPANLAVANRSFKAFANSMSKGTLTALEFQRAQARMNVSLGNVSRRLRDVASKKNQEGFKNISDRMKDLAAVAVLANGPLGGLASRVTVFAAAAKRAGFATASLIAGIAAATVGIVKLGAATIRNARQMNIIRSQLDAVTGSATLTALAFNEVVAISRKSGQALSVVGSQYAKFMIAAQGTTLEGNKARKVFEAMALAAGKLQLPAEQTQGIFKALEQIMSKGTVQAEELRNQLGDRFPGAFKIAAAAMGVTTKKLGEMLKAGKLLSDDFLPKFAAQVVKAFGLGNKIDTFQASFSNLGTSATLFLDKLDSLLGVSKAFKAVLDGVAGALDFLTKNMETLFAVLGALTSGFIVFSLTAIRLTAALAFARTAVTSMAAAIAALNVILLANPIIGFTVLLIRLAFAVTGAVAAFFGFKALLGESSGEMATLKDEVKAFVEATNRMKGSIGGVGETLKQTLIDGVTESRIQIALLTGRLRELNNETAIGKFFRGFGASVGIPIDSIKTLQDQLEKFRKQETDGLKLLDKALKAIQDRRKQLATVGETGGLSQKELDRQAAALKTATMQLDRMQERFESLKVGGLEALKSINAQFAEVDKIEAFRAQLEKTGLSAIEIGKRVGEFAEALTGFDILQEKVTETQVVIDQMQGLVENSFNRIGDAIANMVARGKFDLDSFAAVFRSIVTEILKEAIRLAIIKPLVAGILGGFGGGPVAPRGAGGIPLPMAKPARKGRKLAKGGLLTSSTLFSTASGPVLAGEAGKEAVLPLRRTASGDLGVAAGGGGGANISIIIQTPSPEAFRRSEGQVLSGIRRAVIQGGRAM